MKKSSTKKFEVMHEPSRGDALEKDSGGYKKGKKAFAIKTNKKMSSKKAE